MLLQVGCGFGDIICIFANINAPPSSLKSGLLPVNRTVIKRPTAESLKITLTGIVFQMVSVLFLIEFVHGYKNVYIHQLIRVLLRMSLALLYGYILI